MRGEMRWRLEPAEIPAFAGMTAVWVISLQHVAPAQAGAT
jgi:hypothetical protein